jgi:hypothetical protein
LDSCHTCQQQEDQFPSKEQQKKNERGDREEGKAAEMEAGFLWKESGDQASAARMTGGNRNKSLDWDLNDWRWDTNLFLATPAAAAPSECSIRELSRAQGEIDFGVVVDKRRRLSPVEDGSADCSNSAVADGDNNHVVSVQRGRSSEEEEEERPRKGASSSTTPSCQVDCCHADLSGARDYHKRHKVCEAHTRTTVVCIKNVEHRFCQQCSRLVTNFVVRLQLLIIFFSPAHLCIGERKERLIQYKTQSGKEKRKKKTHQHTLPGCHRHATQMNC